VLGAEDEQSRPKGLTRADVEALFADDGSGDEA
jgi:hypothetical protein